MRGRWFPGFRTGTAGQVQAYRTAEQDRYRNERHEGKARIRWETPRSDRLNERVAVAERPLSGTQRWWHRQVAATRVDRDFTRLQRAANQQRRRSR